MSRWGKNIVVPLDSLCKEKENTNRPTVARSVGTVGKWGKMGFTSTRTYTLSSLHPMAAAAAAASPAQSPAPIHDHYANDLSVSVPEPPKPKKFFKSRNAAPPEVIAQIIQQMPHCSATSPMREGSSTVSLNPTPAHQEHIKLKIAKGNSAERKRKSPKKKAMGAATAPTAATAAASSSVATAATPGASSATSAASSNLQADVASEAAESSPAVSETPKGKKKKPKEEKKLKPEAPPSRILGRARKAVNYCEVDDDERYPTPTKDLIIPKSRTDMPATAAGVTDALNTSTDAAAAGATISDAGGLVLPPPTTAPSATVPSASSSASRTPEHPPIVLRISKGTSRLVSTDSEELPNNSPTQSQPAELDSVACRELEERTASEARIADGLADIGVGDVKVPAANTPKIFVKPPRPPSTDTAAVASDLLSKGAHEHDDEEDEDEEEDEEEEPPEINYCTVKISPDKPPKERLKLIIKTDVIRNAIAKAAAVAAAKAAGEEIRNEKKSKSKKHKHPKHTTAAAAAASAVEQPPLPASTVTVNTVATANTNAAAVATTTAPPTTNITAAATTTTIQQPAASEFKTPSPHLVLSEQAQHQQLQLQQPQQPRGTVISPTTRSDHDFDSQSSVLGSISSKGNSTPQLLAQAVQEDTCVIRSRGSSVITSDLETSQHSSLVAPPSDIELRLESMMMTMDGAPSATNEAHTRPAFVEEPLQEDILAVLRGEVGDDVDGLTTTKLNGNATDSKEDLAPNNAKQTNRATRGRARKANNNNNNNNNNNANGAEESTPTAATRTRSRGKPTEMTTSASTITPSATPTPATTAAATTTGTASAKRVTRGRMAKKAETETNAMEVDETQQEQVVNSTEVEASEEQTKKELTTATTVTVTTPAATTTAAPTATTTTAPTRRGRAARSFNNNAANSNNNNNINKIAASLSAKAEASKAADNSALSTTQRSYGRKRKNQQVTQVLQQQHEESASEASQEQPTPAKVAHTEDLDTAALPDAAVDELSNHSNNSNSNSSLQQDGSCSSPHLRDYKFKDKFKRTITLDNQQVGSNANAAAGDAAAAATAAAETAATGEAQALDLGATPSGNNGEEAAGVEQRGGVKLVISKKKGSIFKSRTLVPSDQGEQATVAKRHLYKHSWDAALEANGAGTSSDVSNASPSTVAGAKTDGLTAAKSTDDAIYTDFGDSSSNNNTSGSGTLRGDSPSLGKLQRVAKPNAPTAGSNAVEDAMSAGGVGSGSNDALTGLRADQRKAKEYYPVVRNVKTAHQIQEIGEYQEMDDDVEYILDALQPQNPSPTRCLSALQLAAKCLTPAFRMHVRAHGVVTKFFKVLSDANRDLSLGLCTSAIMYILSQEGLNMDLDRDSLELMINLLEAEGVAAPSDRANYERNKQKVRELCEEIKAQGKATHLNVESITVGTLAMETLLSLTSKRAGEWFKEDLRKLGGLEHIIKTISNFCQPIIAAAEINWHQSLLDNMQTVARCLRVLENVTQHNEANQRYMLTFAKGRAVDTLCMLYRLCDRQLLLHPTTEHSSKENPGVAMRELLIPLLKVLINLTHTFNEAQPSLGAELLGKRNDVVETSFHLLLLAANYIPDRCVFELSILVLTLLINLSMHTLPNRATLMRAHAPAEYVADNPPSGETVTAIHALLEYFYKCEELARLVEKNTDAFLENNEKGKKKQEEVEETVNNLVQRAGHHMEHTLKGSYAGILIGNLIADNAEHEAVVRRHLRGNSFKEIIGVLEKYHTFMNLTSSMEAAFVAHMKSTKKIIDNFKKRDYLYEHSDEHAAPLNLETTHHHQNSTSGSGSDALATSSNTQPQDASATTASTATSATASSASTGATVAATGAATTTTAAASAAGNTSSASAPASSTSPTSNCAVMRSNNMPRVYKTYSSHR